MSAYAIARPGRPISPTTKCQPPDGLRLVGLAEHHGRSGAELSLLDSLLADLAKRVAAAVVEQLSSADDEALSEWLDSRAASAYLGVHRDTLRKLAAERAIPAHQDGPGCKLFFRRPDLDAWRRNGGRAVHLCSALPTAA